MPPKLVLVAPAGGPSCSRLLEPAGQWAHTALSLSLTEMHLRLDGVVRSETGHRVGHLAEESTSETIIETADT
jgi:hypothetical protein